jgi:hypothetical protein
LIYLNKFLYFCFFIPVIIIFIFVPEYNNYNESIIILNFSFFIILLQLIYLIARHRTVVDLHFYFTLLSFIYFLVVPYTVYFYEINIYYGQRFRELDPSILIKSNLITISGLFFYTILSIPIKRFKINFQKLKMINLNQQRKLLIIFLIIVGVACFFRLFYDYGFNSKIFIGALEDRSRYNFTAVTGYAYLKSLLFCFNFAFMLILLNYRGGYLKYLFLTIVLFYLLIVLTIFDGQRITTLGFLIASILIYKLKYLSKDSINSLSHFFKNSLNIKYTILFSTALFFLVVYGQYRSGNLGKGVYFDEIFDYSLNSLYYIINIFDSAITYPIVINEIYDGESYWYGKSITSPILNRIPTYFFENKVDYIYGAGKFSQLFLNYNQLDPESVARSCSMRCNLFLNFGAIGVIVGISLIALILNLINRKIIYNHNDYLVVIIYVSTAAYILPYVFKSNFFQAVSMFDVKFIVLLSLIWIIKNIKRRKSNE